MAVGDGILFATSRPDFDEEVFETRWGRNPSKLPPWTVINVFEWQGDTLIKRKEVILGNPEEEELYYSTGLVALGRAAFVPLVDTGGDRSSAYSDCNHRRVESEDLGNCGFAIVDASVPEEAFVRGFYRRLGRIDGIQALNEKLYMHYRQSGFGVPESEFDILDGLLGLDPSAPIEPRYLGYFGTPYLDDQLPPAFMASAGQRVYKTHPSSIIQTFEIDDAGRPSLLGMDHPDDEEGARRLIRPENTLAWLGLERFIGIEAFAEKLLVLTSDRGFEGGELPGEGVPSWPGTNLGLVDMQEALDPALLDVISFPDLSFDAGVMRAREHETLADMGSDLAVSEDGRAFLAAGEHAMMIEIGTENNQLREEARYPEIGKVHCAVREGGLTYARASDFGQLSILAPSQSSGIPEIRASVPISTAGSSCVMAISDNRLFAAVDGGLQAYTLDDPLLPEKDVRYDFDFHVSGIQIVGDIVFVAAGSNGIFALDLSRDPSDPLVDHIGSPAYSLALEYDPLDKYLYVAEGNDGIGVIDASDPTDLREVGVIPSTGETMRVRLIDGTLYVLGRALGQGRLYLSVYDPESAARLDIETMVIAEGLQLSGEDIDFDISADGRTIFASDGEGIRRFERPASGEHLIDHGRIETSGPIKAILAGETAGDPWLGVVESGGISVIEEVR